jgi:type II secretory pathway pseudopilin PulG
LPTCRLRCSVAGFAYLLLLIAVAVLGIASAAAVSVGSRVARRDAEAQLLAIGAELERALLSYRTMAAAAPSTGPRTLEDLLRDPRRPNIVRHLRQVYADPLTGKAEWGLVKAPDGSIVGVYSLADGEPIKRSGFDADHARFAYAHGYAQWVFQAPSANQAIPAL